MEKKTEPNAIENLVIKASNTEFFKEVCKVFSDDNTIGVIIIGIRVGEAKMAILPQLDPGEIPLLLQSALDNYKNVNDV